MGDEETKNNDGVIWVRKRGILRVFNERFYFLFYFLANLLDQAISIIDSFSSNGV